MKQSEVQQGQLVIASATGRPRGVKHLVFRELLGFEVGGGTDYLRNVIDSYLISDDAMASIIELAQRLGRGGLIFVSQAYGKSMVKVVAEALNKAGVRAVHAISNPRESR
jgi:Reverse gyrase